MARRRNKALQRWAREASRRRMEQGLGDSLPKAVGKAVRAMSGQVKSQVHWEAERQGESNLLIGLLEKQPAAKLEAGSHTDFHREAEQRNHHLWSACQGLNSSHEQLKPSQQPVK